MLLPPATPITMAGPLTLLVLPEPGQWHFYSAQRIYRFPSPKARHNISPKTGCLQQIVVEQICCCPASFAVSALALPLIIAPTFLPTMGTTISDRSMSDSNSASSRCLSANASRKSCIFSSEVTIQLPFRHSSVQHEAIS